MIEDTKKALVDELKVKHADTSEVNRLQHHLDGVQSRLQEVEGKLEKSTKDLSKEQARNKSAAKHNQVNNIFMWSILSIKIIDRQQGNFYFFSYQSGQTRVSILGIVLLIKNTSKNVWYKFLFWIKKHYAEVN